MPWSCQRIIAVLPLLGKSAAPLANSLGTSFRGRITVGEHRLEAGRELIDALEALGEALGYAAEREYPLHTSSNGVATAVDLAWLKTESSSAPLFLFEVES